MEVEWMDVLTAHEADVSVKVASDSKGLNLRIKKRVWDRLAPGTNVRSVGLQFAAFQRASLVRITPKTDGPWRLTGNDRAGLSVRASTLVASKEFEAVSCDARIEGNSIIVTLPADFALKDKAMVRAPTRKPL
jgi:hypothetical protein